MLAGEEEPGKPGAGDSRRWPPSCTSWKFYKVTALWSESLLRGAELWHVATSGQALKHPPTNSDFPALNHKAVLVTLDLLEASYGRAKSLCLCVSEKHANAISMSV